MCEWLSVCLICMSVCWIIGMVLLRNCVVCVFVFRCSLVLWYVCSIWFVCFFFLFFWGNWGVGLLKMEWYSWLSFCCVLLCCCIIGFSLFFILCVVLSCFWRFFWICLVWCFFCRILKYLCFFFFVFWENFFFWFVVLYMKWWILLLWYFLWFLSFSLCVLLSVWMWWFRLVSLLFRLWMKCSCFLRVGLVWFVLFRICRSWVFLVEVFWICVLKFVMIIFCFDDVVGVRMMVYEFVLMLVWWCRSICCEMEVLDCICGVRWCFRMVWCDRW